MRFKNQMRSHGGIVHMIGMRPGIRQTFSVTGLDKLFEMNEYAERSA